MALEQSIVYRQLAGKSRFSRIDFGDMLIGLVPWALHTTAATFADWSPYRPYVTLAASVASLFLFRIWVPEGFGPLLYLVNTPHQLSAFGSDRLGLYPPATSSRKARRSRP